MRYFPYGVLFSEREAKVVTRGDAERREFTSPKNATQKGAIAKISRVV